ncbi:MAG TPA: YihY/virulence factor BrkB family protein [Gemmatimonadaceae bacterium]
MIGGYRVRELAKRTASEMMDDDVFTLAASGAYYFFFSLFPLLLFLAPVLSYVGDKEMLIGGIMQQLSPLMPIDARQVVEAVLRDVVFTTAAPALMSVGGALAAFTASNVIAMLTGALNIAYEVTEPRPWWKRRLLALVFVVLGGLVVALSTTVLIAGERIVLWATRAFGLEELTMRILSLLQYPITFAVIVAVIWLIYYILPAVKQSARRALVGAVFAAVLWVLVTLGFRLYVYQFGGYNRTYGAIGGIIILLMWMYLTMVVLLAGGELNAELHKGTGAVTPRRPVLLDGRIPTHEPAHPPGQLS